MYCGNCGILENSGKFCENCGGKLMSEISYQGLRFSKGEQEGFDKLYQLTYKAILGEARVFINESDAEDCVQAIFIKLINNIKSFDSNKSSFNTWFQTLRKNEIITFSTKLQKNQTYKPKDDNELDLMIDNIENEDLSGVPGVDLEKEECKRLVLTMLQEVPVEQSQCIIKFYLDGSKQKDIATELNIPEGTVKSRLSKGKSALKEIVKSYENNGVVLRSASPFLFFLSLAEGAQLQSGDLTQFGEFNLTSTVSIGNELATLCQEKGFSSVSSAASLNVATEVTATAVTSASKLLIVKIVAGIAIVGTLGVGAVTMLPEKEADEVVNDTMEDIVEDEIVTIEPELNSEELTILEYREILQVYFDVLFNEGRANDAHISAEILTQRLAKYEPNGIFEFNAYGAQNLYYGLFDLNGDGELEMVITTNDPLMLNGTYDDFIMDSVWTCSGEEIRHLLDRTWGQIKLYSNGNAVVHYAGSDFDETIWMHYSAVDGVYGFEKVVVYTGYDGYSVSYDKTNFESCSKDMIENGKFYDVNDIQWYQFNGIDQEDNKIN